MSHLRAVPDPDEPDDRIDPDLVEPVDPAAAVAPESLAGAPEEDVRRYPSTIGGAFYLSILVVAIASLVIATRADWRLGVQMLGGALLVAALLRLLLASRDAGMLAVRHRLIDVVLLSGAGAALVVLATSIPNQPA